MKIAPQADPGDPEPGGYVHAAAQYEELASQHAGSGHHREETHAASVTRQIHEEAVRVPHQSCQRQYAQHHVKHRVEAEKPLSKQAVSQQPRGDRDDPPWP